MVIRMASAGGLAIAIVLLIGEAAMACSCAHVAPRKQLAAADGAVTARLLGVQRLDGGPPAADFVYRTGRVVKGSARGLRRGRRLAVRSAYESASCGLSRRVGSLTGLFLTRARGRWRSNSCNEITARTMRALGGAAARPDRPACA